MDLLGSLGLVIVTLVPVVGLPLPAWFATGRSASPVVVRPSALGEKLVDGGGAKSSEIRSPIGFGSY